MLAGNYLVLQYPPPPHTRGRKETQNAFDQSKMADRLLDCDWLTVPPHLKIQWLSVIGQLTGLGCGPGALVLRINKYVNCEKEKCFEIIW